MAPHGTFGGCSGTGPGRGNGTCTGSHTLGSRRPSALPSRRPLKSAKARIARSATAVAIMRATTFQILIAATAFRLYFTPVCSWALRRSTDRRKKRPNVTPEESGQCALPLKLKTYAEKPIHSRCSLQSEHHCP